MFKNHITEDISKTKIAYEKAHKDRILKEIMFVDSAIKFQIGTIETRLKESLKEKVQIALEITNHIYNTHKDKLSKEEIKEKISQALSAIRFNDNRGYYFMYDNKTKIIFGHPIKKIIGQNMNGLRDMKGQDLIELDENILKNQKIGFRKIYFNKPNNENKSFPKITCIAKFEPLDFVIGTGEYLDIIENQIKGYVLKRFSKFKDKDRYLFIIDIHNIEGGDDFGTLILSPNRQSLVGKKISDDVKDIKGTRYREEFLKVIREKGGGFSQYWYKKPSTQKNSLKMSYIHLQKDWNWMIGNGFYYDDLDNEIALMKESIISYTNKTINRTITWVLFLSLIAILIAIFVSLKIDKTIKTYTNKIIDYEQNKRDQAHLLVQQSKMAAMGEMLGNIAHQWRQPLSTISTASTGAKLQKELNILTDEQLDLSLTAINNSAQYLSQTIDDFRGFFNPTNNVVVTINIKEIVSKTLTLIKSQFVSKNITIIENIEDYKLETISNELIQVLINILNNARDVLIIKDEKEKRIIFINTYKKEDISYIEILDNGGGIKEEIIDKIFEPYFTTKDKSQGTGIGLYMSYDIITNHLDGKFSASTEFYRYEGIEYKGAKFTIKI